MANDRIMLRCKKCHDEKMLFKHYSGPDTSYANTDGLDEWMCDHLYRCQERYALNGDPGFDLVTESKPR